MSSSLELLTQINLDDLVKAFGWEGHPFLRGVLRTVFRGAARKLAAHVLQFDEEVGRSGLSRAAQNMLSRYVRSLSITGAENIPRQGPLLVLSNHPGMSDTLCLFVAIQRSDLSILALDRPFLQALPHVRQRLFFLDESPAKRMSAVRQTIGHLKQGGAVLTFSAGQIEPDPDVYEGAPESLALWHNSTGIFLRMVPQIHVVPALVRGVLWPKAVKHPLIKLKRRQDERERLGAALQLLAQVLYEIKPVDVKIAFGQPITLETLGTSDPHILHQAVLNAMRYLMQTKE